jgi:single-strand DNA-binding protein
LLLHRLGIAILLLNKYILMKAIKNKVQLIGHLGADPEIKNFKEDSKLANMRLAVNDRYKNVKGEWVEETQWFNLVAWSKLAIYAEKYLLKGIEVAVEGRLLTKSYTDKNAVKRISTDIVVSEILILTKKAALTKELV